MGESRSDRERRHLNEDHRARRAQSKRTIGLYKSQERIGRLTDAIESAQTPDERPIPEEFTRLAVEWMYKKSSILSTISSSPFLTDETKAAWSRVLQEATVTDRDDATLTDLRLSVMFESVKFDGRPGRSASLTELVGEVATLIQIRVQARAHL
jgi:hypothetical protein